MYFGSNTQFLAHCHPSLQNKITSQCTSLPYKPWRRGVQHSTILLSSSSGQQLDKCCTTTVTGPKADKIILFHLCQIGCGSTSLKAQAGHHRNELANQIAKRGSNQQWYQRVLHKDPKEYSEARIKRLQCNKVAKWMGHYNKRCNYENLFHKNSRQVKT